MEEFVLRTTTIEEASIDGNVRVNENVYIDQLDFEDNGSTLDNIAIPGFHDQSTNAQICGAQVLQVDVTAILRLANLLLGPGFCKGTPISGSSPTLHTQLRPWLCNSDSVHTTPITSTDRLLITSLIALA